MAAARVKNQHTVQAALLKGFADDHGYLQRRSRSGLDTRTAAKHATTVENFYTFRRADGTLDDAIERRWATLENRLPALRGELITTGALTGRSKREFDRYVAYSLTRTRLVRHIGDEVERLSLRAVTRMETARALGVDPMKLRPSDAAVIDSLGSLFGRLGASSAPDPQIRRLRVVVRTAVTFQRRLRPVDWILVIFPEPALITSDAGVAPLRPNGTYRGLLEPGESVVVPLSPTSLALGARKRRLESLVESDLAGASNRAMAVSAFEDTFRHRAMRWPDGLELRALPAQPAEEPGRPGTTRNHSADAAAALADFDSARGIDPFSRDLLDVLNTAQAEYLRAIDDPAT